MHIDYHNEWHGSISGRVSNVIIKDRCKITYPAIIKYIESPVRTLIREFEDKACIVNIINIIKFIYKHKHNTISSVNHENFRQPWNALIT